MKTLVKVTCVLAVALLAAAQARASTFINEQFTYSDGDLTNVSSGLWITYSGNPAINVVSGMAVVNDALLGNTADDGITFGGTHSNDVLYGAFDVNWVTVPKGAGSYFALFKNSSTFFDPRIWATNNAGSVRLGISNGSGTPATFWASDIAVGGTHRIVFKLDQTGANIASSMWLDPATEGSTSISGTDVFASGTLLVAFGLRQNSSSTGVGKVYVDNLIVGTTFGDVIPEPSTVMLLGVGLVGLLAFRRRS